MPTVDEHFSGRSAHVLAIYRKIVDASSALGPMAEDPKKTSIHLNRHVAFAGVQTRKDALILTLKADRDMKHQRVHKTEQTVLSTVDDTVRLPVNDLAVFPAGQSPKPPGLIAGRLQGGRRRRKHLPARTALPRAYRGR